MSHASMKRLRAIALVALAAAAVSPASARRRARRPAPKPAPAVTSPAPSPDVARSVILFVADGYSAADWRAARGDKFLALDRLPVAGVALPPSGLDAYDPATLGRALGTGQGPDDAAPPVALLSLAGQYGKTVALVSGDSPASALLCGLTLGSAPDGPDAWRQLTARRVAVMFGRALPEMERPAPGAPGYTVSTTADEVLTAEQMPAIAAVPAENVPFETLLFRALHLAARGPKGFMLAASARPDEVPATALDAAIATAVRYAERDRRTLVLVVCRRGETEMLVHAFGPAAHKFGGVLAATDIPKIVAGVAGLKVFRRDFSPLFLERAVAATPAPPVLKPAGKGIQSLPW